MVTSGAINHPGLWQHLLPLPEPSGHKYDRGHALVHGAFELTGATYLASAACSRIGAGLVTVIAPKQTEVYRAILPPEIMVRKKIDEHLRRVTAILAGPGGASKSQQRNAIENPWGAACILDANAIPLAKDGSYPVLPANTVLTPHDGEFARAFPALTGERREKAIAAAVLSGAIIVLKGMTTIIAAPDGRLVLNEHGSPWLAKAGTGDVLAGMITGLAAQGMELFDACATACWIHGEAGIRIGPGLVASDIEKVLGTLLKELLL